MLTSSVSSILGSTRQVLPGRKNCGESVLDWHHSFVHRPQSYAPAAEAPEEDVEEKSAGAAIAEAKGALPPPPLKVGRVTNTDADVDRKFEDAR